MLQSLPEEKRRSLAAKLLETPQDGGFFRESHTLPIGTAPLQRHTQALVTEIDLFKTLLAPPTFMRFHDLTNWIENLNSSHLKIRLLILMMSPFAIYNRNEADKLFRTLRLHVHQVAAQVELGVVNERAQSRPEISIRYWEDLVGSDAELGILNEAFKTESILIDQESKFRPDWVFRSYAYAKGDLLKVLDPHMDSLGLTGLPDLLASIWIIGNILIDPDPLYAYFSMHLMVQGILSSPSSLKEELLSNLRQKSDSIERANRGVQDALKAAKSAFESEEEIEGYLASCYIKLVEGPFREYAWTLFCGAKGNWESSPKITRLREQLISHGGHLGRLAKIVILPGLRNGEAHQTLTWDGFSEEFVTQTSRYSLRKVCEAIDLGRSFSLGCDLGWAALRSLEIEHEKFRMPRADEPGRMPLEYRVSAFFGSNNLAVTKQNVATRNAWIEVGAIGKKDINPCFQALLLTYQAIPQIENFRVRGPKPDDPQIEVSRASLEATLPIWKVAVRELDKMPLSVFLPMNFEARSKSEELSKALRSTAWIATDDLLDALDGSPMYWTIDTHRRLRLRFKLVREACLQLTAFTAHSNARVRSVVDTTQQLEEWLVTEAPLGRVDIDSNSTVIKLRHQWEHWGPVLRLPNVLEGNDTVGIEQQPGDRAQGPEVGYLAF